MGTLIRKLLTTLYPNRCLRCDRITSNRFFCSGCDTFDPIDKKTCQRCGLPIALCCCKWNFYYFDAHHGVFENADEVRQSFYHFKFGGHYAAGAYFAGQMASLVERSYDTAQLDLITAVPTHPATKRQRGYDHTAVLAKALSKELSIPYVATLRQPKRTEKQHEVKGIEARFDTVRDKYRVRRGISLAGKRILLLDDISTTGATLSSCARELKLAGAQQVYAVTALITYPKKKASHD